MTAFVGVREGVGWWTPKPHIRAHLTLNKCTLSQTSPIFIKVLPTQGFTPSHSLLSLAVGTRDHHLRVTSALSKSDISLLQSQTC